MHYLHRLLAVLALLSVTAAAHGKPQEYQTGAEPAWVLPIPAFSPAAATPLKPSGGVDYLLRDIQVRVDARGKTSYFHSALKALNGKGVQQVANISVNFDPSYQTLTLHMINVIRDGQVIRKLGTAPVHVLQRETELDYLVYDGSKTASVLLDDVRIGDVVEYAFSVDGVNPVFQNKLAGNADLEWSVPLRRAHARLLLPLGRSFRVETRNSKLQPEVREGGGYRDYRWDQREVPPLKVDDGAPGWYDPYGYVQWTEFANWAAVAQWALPLYRPGAPGAALQREIDRIAREQPAPAGRIAAALQLVQRDIRYLGIEVGQGSHAPTAPAKVWERRFGDCKDKTLLTVAMLRALGADAAPALVNTSMQKAIGAWVPTPNAFNHVLVRVRLDGKTYWLDPTRDLQQGDLEHLAQASYGYALVLEPGASALTPMPPPRGGRREVRAVFDSSAGLDQPVSYRITTVLRGSAADNLRAELARDRAELEKQYVNYYVRRYPGLRGNGEMEVHDDAAGNALTTVEHYLIPAFWPHSDANERREATVKVSEIGERFKAPDAVGRNAPLKLNHPDEIDETIEVKLPKRWSIDAGSTRVRDPAFEYDGSAAETPDRRGIVLHYRYRALADQVEPGDMGNYAAHLKQARDDLGYELYSNDAGRSAAPMRRLTGFDKKVVAGGVLLTAWGWLAFMLQTTLAPHRPLNKRLLACFVVASGAWMPYLCGVGRDNVMLAMAVGATVLVVRYLWRIAPTVPATHPAYALARHAQPRMRAPAASAALAFVRTVPALVGWVTIVMVALRWLGQA
jgi:hypothetical protein